MLIRRAEVGGRGPLDVRVADGRIAAVGSDLGRAPGEPVLDAKGGALLPGLHDHHLHLLALAAALASARCGPPEARDARALAGALARPPGPDGWVRGVGYHESVAGELERSALDALASHAPVRVQHRSGRLWTINSLGVAWLGLDSGADAPGVERDARGRATGRLYDLDLWLRERLGPTAPDLAPVGRRLARYGVSGATDATPTLGAGELELLTRAVDTEALPQELWVMGGASLPPPGHPRVHRAARKLYLRETALPELDALVGELRAGGRRPVAVHCVSRAELVFALAALRAGGTVHGDRIEHAAVAPPELVAQIAELGVAVVVQPHFVQERGDVYLSDVEPADRAWLHRGRAFLEAGVPLAAGSDAPFGHPDPWRSMRTAVERQTCGGRTLGALERLTPEEALGLFLSPAEAPGAATRELRAGAPADLCLLDRPWRAAREALSSDCVAASWTLGELRFTRE